MLEPLPKGDFRFLTLDEINAFDMTNVSSWDVFGQYAYFFVVDIEVPKSIHDLTSNYRMYTLQVSKKLTYITYYISF